jgi:DNA end-binding protein Ku
MAARADWQGQIHLALVSIPVEIYDRYVDALRNLIEKKRKAKGEKILEEVGEEAPIRKGNVIDLMAALKTSVDSGGTAKPVAKRAPARKAAPKPAAEKAPTRKRA